MKQHKYLIIYASMILLAATLCTGGDEPSTNASNVIQLEKVQKNLFELRNRLKLYKAQIGSYPPNLQMLVDKGYLKVIPKNELVINDGSVASVQNGTADWYYDPMHGVIEPGSKEVENKISTSLQAPQKPSAIIPQKGIQDCLESIALSTNEKQLNDGIEKLRQLSGNKLGKILVPQILYYQIDDKNKTHHQVTMVNYGISKLDIGKGEYLLGILPYIGTAEPKLSQRIHSILDYIESGNTGEPDYSYYYSILEGYQRASESIPPELIKYMYKRSPGQAMLISMRIYSSNKSEEWKPVLWTEHIINDVLWKQQYGFLKPDETEPAAMEQLDKLSQHKAWWARLYVAEIIQQHPEFKTIDIIKRLEADENELVRQTMNPKPAPPTQPATQPASLK